MLSRAEVVVYSSGLVSQPLVMFLIYIMDTFSLPATW